MAEVSMKRHGRANELVVFFGAAGIGTGGGWGADAVPRGTGQRRGRVVLVDEHLTSRACTTGHQACRLEAPSRAGGTPPAAPSLEPAARPASEGHVVVPDNGPTQAPTGPMQQPGSLTASSLRAWAQHSPASPAQQAHQG
ncbi:hypothetical protein HaLaN_27538 [Haematococcus lacustris]|uniref:Uncharacterized protein n=1 Tax=Haematococcus lacustris TaxID=44745 RepID=A0A6A0A8D8_HAELA|nr:hypothetical protein HaLaN_27538 [Haematococcus lacustris]